MLYKPGDAKRPNTEEQKNVLIRQINEAFQADDRETCIDAIERLYALLDKALSIPRRERRR